MIIIKLIKF